MNTSEALREIETANQERRGANLHSADLRGAIMSFGVLIGTAPRISVEFSHQWALTLFRSDKGVFVICGCRCFNVADARKHWAAHFDPQRQSIVLPALDAALAIAKAQGWEVC